MQQKTFSANEIVSILQSAEHPDVQIKELCRQHGITDTTFYRWRKKYAGVDDASALKELKTLRDENARLKKLVANQAMDIDMLKEVNAKKW